MKKCCFISVNTPVHTTVIKNKEMYIFLIVLQVVIIALCLKDGLGFYFIR